MLLSPHLPAAAQGVTGAGIHGTVAAESPAGAGVVHVLVTHVTTGFKVEVEARNGRFLIQGLEPGGPYSILVRRLGFVAARREGIRLRLGGLLEMEFALKAAPVQLDRVSVAPRHDSPAHSQVNAGPGP